MQGSGYIKSLDGVRAIAILLVLTFHSNLTHFGWVGVQLFFVLSGFLITSILWKDKASDSSVLQKFRKFWIRRSLRIFPLYYGFLAVIGIAYLVAHFPPYVPAYFLSAATYTINFQLAFMPPPGNPVFHHLWSLAIEEQFYLIFPFLMLLGSRKWIRISLVAVIFLSPVIRYLLGEYYIQKGLPESVIANAVNFNTLAQLDAFCMGGIISVFMLDDRIKKPLLYLLLSVILLLVAGTVSYLTSPVHSSYLMDFGYYHYLVNNYQHVWHYTLLNLAFASLILVLVTRRDRRLQNRFSFLEAKWLVEIGKVSYGMYIFHWVIWAYVFNTFFNLESYWMKAAVFIPYVIVVYFVSAISYRFFELPFIRLKDRFAATTRK